jgi:small-conductance mechanosensitive channel
MIEIKDVMDISMKSVDKTLADTITHVVPTINAVQLTIATQVAVFASIIIVFTALGRVANWVHSRIVKAESDESMENKPQATTATVARPLATILPAVGWLIAFQRAVTGYSEFVLMCDKHKKHLGPTVMKIVHSVKDWTAPLQSVLADCIGILVVSSLTWTLLLLKRRWFNTLLARLSVDGTSQETKELKRTLVPLNDLASWVLVGLSGTICLRILGVDPSPLLALGSVSGIVVGFASQNLLLNLISGISIFITRPFVVGDFVAVRNGAALVAMGTISNISPLRTTFLDDGSRSVTVPNKVLTDMVITNYRKARLPSKEKGSKSGFLKMHMDFEFTLRAPPDYKGGAYDDVAKEVIRALLVRMSILKDVQSNSPAAYICGLTNSGEIIIHVSAMGIATEKVSCDSVREKFLLAIHRALCASNAQMK